MKHAGDQALDNLEGLLCELRQCPLLKEKKRGVFYVKARAFLHFHEDPAGLFADVRPGDSWERLPVSTKAEQGALVARVKAALL